MGFFNQSIALDTLGKIRRLLKLRVTTLLKYMRVNYKCNGTFANLEARYFISIGDIKRLQTVRCHVTHLVGDERVEGVHLDLPTASPLDAFVVTPAALSAHHLLDLQTAT